MNDTMQLPLTRGKVTIIDSDMAEYVQTRKWAFNGKNALSENWREERASIILQRFIMKAQKDEYVININGDRLDNRRCNLRIVPLSHVSAQNGPGPGNKTGYKGVYFCRRVNKYHGTIKCKGKNVCLGFYNNPEMPAKLYDVMAFEYYGPNVYFNFPIKKGRQTTT